MEDRSKVDQSGFGKAKAANDYDPPAIYGFLVRIEWHMETNTKKEEVYTIWSPDPCDFN